MSGASSSESEDEFEPKNHESDDDPLTLSSDRPVDPSTEPTVEGAPWKRIFRPSNAGSQAVIRGKNLQSLHLEENEGKMTLTRGHHTKNARLPEGKIPASPCLPKTSFHLLGPCPSNPNAIGVCVLLRIFLE